MYKRLLVAVDGSDLSYKVLAQAGVIAEKFDSELKILSVVPNQMLFTSPSGGFYHDVIFFDGYDKIMQAFKKILANAEAKVRSEHTDLKVSTILREGRPSVNIVDVAEKEGCSLIIMGCRRIGAIFRLFEESTSQSVINSSKIPVMIISIA